jgi:uncharacterized protein (TIGR02646 family)
MIGITRGRIGRPTALDRRSPRDRTTELERAREHYVTRKETANFDFKIYSDPEVKDALGDLFHGKCAYCESPYAATQPVDVEHYRPKGGIATDQGETEKGYWWLASDWDNLLPSCIDCNRARKQTVFDGREMKTGKGERFPLADESRRARNEGEEAGETPLLLNPCIDKPSDYLVFVDTNDHSIVRPLAVDQTSLEYRRAHQSIEIYGLNRDGLVRQRTAHLKSVNASVRRLRCLIGVLDREADPQSREELKRLIADERDLLKKYEAEHHHYTATARTVIDPVKQRLNLPGRPTSPTLHP